MDNFIAQQFELNIKELIGEAAQPSPSANQDKFSATITPCYGEYSKAQNNSAALLQINIAQEHNSRNQLAAAVDIINKDFAAVTIFIDLQLALLIYRITLPYMSESQLQNIITRKKIDWATQHIDIINQTTMPWSIVTDQDQTIQQDTHDNITQINNLLKNDAVFRQYLAADVKTLKSSFLCDNYKINIDHYNQAQNKNDKELRLYLINSLATVMAMKNLKHNQHIYITENITNSYEYLEKESLLPHLPKYATLHFIKTPTDEHTAACTSTELNHKIHSLEILDKITSKKSYLEQSIKHFTDNVYLYTTDCTLLGCNNQQSLSFGMSDASYLNGKPLTEFFSQKEVDMFTGTAKEIVNTKSAKVLKESSHYLGKKLPFLSIKTPLRNQKQKTIGIIGFSMQLQDMAGFEDVTNMGRDDIMQLVMQKDQQKIDNIPSMEIGSECEEFIAGIKKTIEHMPGYAFWQDLHGKIIGCNHNHAELLGVDSTKDAIGKYPSDFLIDEDAATAQLSLIEMATTGKPVIIEETYKVNGNLKVMMSHKTPIKNDIGEVIGIMVAAIDISKNRQQAIKLQAEKESLTASNDMKDNFIKTIKHDMREAFASLCSMTELCVQQETDITKKEQLDEISSCAKALLTLSKDLSSINESNSISMKDLVNNAILTKSAAMQEKSISFKLEYDEKIPKTIHGNSYRLKKTLHNILNDVVNDGNHGHITLVVKLESQKDNDVVISCAAIDSDINISKEDQQYIFNRYDMIDYTNYNIE